MSSAGDDWNSNATMEEFGGTPTLTSPRSGPQSPAGDAWEDYGYPLSGSQSGYASHRTTSTAGRAHNAPSGFSASAAHHTPSAVASAGHSRPLSPMAEGREGAAVASASAPAAAPEQTIAQRMAAYVPREYADTFTADIEAIAPTVTASFASTEDAIQTMIALAALPLSSGPSASDASIGELMDVPMPTLLARLAAEPRAARLAEYRDPPLPPHPSSTLLLVKRRLHDEYRQAKMRQRERYLSAEEAIRAEHERLKAEALEAHRRELSKLAAKEAAHAPPLPMPTARTLQVLERQMADAGAGEAADDPAARRLAAFWKAKYERTCEALVRATERLSAANNEYAHLSQLGGRDPPYLEKALVALRDGEMEEQMRGDAVKQQFLLECRRRGITPSEASARGAPSASKAATAISRRTVTKQRQAAEAAAATQQSLAEQLGSAGGGGADDSLLLRGKASGGGNEEEDDGSLGGTKPALFMLPPDVPYVETFSEEGYRVPAVRDVALRIEALRKEVEIADGAVGFLLEAVAHREAELDAVQTRFSEQAGAMVFDDELPAVEENIRLWAAHEQSEAEGFAAALDAMQLERDRTREATERAMVVGKSILRAKRLEEELRVTKHRLNVEYAEQKLLRMIPSDAERAHLSYLDAQLTSLSSERRLLRQEVSEAERRARRFESEVEARLQRTGLEAMPSSK